MHAHHGHLPPYALQVYRDARYRLRVEGVGQNVTDCETCRGVQQPRPINVQSTTPPAAIGEVVNAAMLTDLDGHFQVALLSDELTGFVFVRPATGATEFMRDVVEFYDMLHQVALVQSQVRSFRCRIYTDEMAVLRAFLQQYGIRMTDRVQGSSTRGPFPFVRIAGYRAIGPLMVSEAPISPSLFSVAWMIGSTSRIAR